MGDSIYVIKPDTFFSNIAQDNNHSADFAPHYENIWTTNKKHNEYKLKVPYEQKQLIDLYNAIANWDTGNSLTKAEWKQWALNDFEGFKEYYKQYRTLIKNLDIDKLYSAKAKPNRIASYGSKTDIGKELFQSLLKAGFSEVQALAILANSYHETMGWNKMNQLNNGPASGLLQMEEAARQSYDNFRETNNLEENTDTLAQYIASLFLNGKSIPTTYYDNSGKQTHPVAQKQPNELGLYDMSGNVAEWCQDWYGCYSSIAQTNPQGSAFGLDRVNRGGDWRSHYAKYCRVSTRLTNSPDNRFNYLGLRLCLIP